MRRRYDPARRREEVPANARYPDDPGRVLSRVLKTLVTNSGAFAVVAILASMALSACSAAAPSTEATLGLPGTPAASRETPTGTPAASRETPNPWSSAGIDPAPGNVVVTGLAAAQGVSPDDVVAAVFLLNHPAGNVATVWVFRAQARTTQQMLERWTASERHCSRPEPVSVRGLDAVLLGRPLADQCQPQYVVRLDADTLAIITDNGGYRGNAAPPSGVPYRPIEDIGHLVDWIQAELPRVELVPGGPPATQG